MKPKSDNSPVGGLKSKKESWVGASAPKGRSRPVPLERLYLMQPLITNDRAAREWQWLINRFGDAAVRDAISRLPGGRKPFPLNVARVLGVEFPPESVLPALTTPSSRQKAQEALLAIKARLGMSLKD